MRSFFTVIAILSVTFLGMSHAEILFTNDNNIWMCTPNVSTKFPSNATAQFNCTTFSTPDTNGDVYCIQANGTGNNPVIGCAGWQVLPNTVLNFGLTGPIYSLYCCGLCKSANCTTGDEMYNNVISDTVCPNTPTTNNNGSSWNCTSQGCNNGGPLTLNPATNWTFICTNPNCTGTSSYVLSGEDWECLDPNCPLDDDGMSWNTTTSDFNCRNDECSDYPVYGNMVRTTVNGNLTFTCANSTCSSMTYDSVNNVFTACNAIAPPGPTPTPPSGGSSWFYYIIILAIIGAAVFFGRRHMQKQRLQQELNQHLQKA